MHHVFTRALPGALALVLVGLCGAAAAATPNTAITSAGPLTSIHLGNDLSCQVTRAGSNQLYPTATVPGDCGTFAVYDNTLYKADFAAHGGTATAMGSTGTAVAPVSQSAVTGSGTSADPYKVVTVVTAGAKLRITQTARYVTGDDWWTTDVSVKNLTASPLSTSIYRGMDCFLGGSDSGYGFLDAASGGAGCSINANNNPVGLVEALIPAPGHAVRYFQASYDAVWSAIAGKGDLANTCQCTGQIDNGVALQWPLTLSAQQTQVVSFNTVFDPAGSIPAPPPGLVPPSPVTTPSVDTTATPHVGTPVSATPGTWDDPTATERYQWQRCTSTATTSCTDIPGATSDTYTPTSSDLGHRLRLVQTATNADGGADTASDLTPAVAAARPSNTAAPATDPTATRGSVVHGTAGTWTGATATAVRWQRCPTTLASSCTDIAGATTLDYTPAAADVDHHLRLVETATNATGSTEQASASTGVVAGLPPVVDVAPSVSAAGRARTGEAVAGARGTWTDAVSYALRWERCADIDVTTCSDIPGATASVYAPVAQDAGQYVRLVVTATNPWGSTTASSPLGDRVLPAPPAVVVAPGTTAGSAASQGDAPVATGPVGDAEVAVGTELRPDTGTFTGATDVTYLYQRCATDDESSCADIAGATAQAYTPAAADAGYRLRLVVVAANAGGSVRVPTPMTRVVQPKAANAGTQGEPAGDTQNADRSGAPVPTACVSRRSVTLHWRLPARERARSFSVTINGAPYATLPAGRQGANIRMGGRPAQQLAVVVTARTAAGRTYATTRRYRTCAGRLTGSTLRTLQLERVR
jgi:hypothetical protein